MTFNSVNDIFSLLNGSYGDIDKEGTVQNSIMDYSPGNLPLVKFLPVQHTLTKKSYFDNVALTAYLRRAYLRRALYLEIMARMLFMDIADLTLNPSESISSPFTLNQI